MMDGTTACGGVIVTDADGNYIERYACEVHLFDTFVCTWQAKVYEERSARRAARVTND